MTGLHTLLLALSSRRDILSDLRFGLAIAVSTLMICLLAAACATQSVRHLKQQPWVLERPQVLRTNYLRFDYVCSQGPHGLKVHGTARPLENGPVPNWATWTRDLWIGAYLSDRSGQVLAKNLKVLSPQRLDQSHPITFTFVLRPQSMGQPGPVYISFGYRLVLTTSSDSADRKGTPSPDQRPVFFASESALTRF